MEYKWTVLSNTTLGTLMSSLDSNIVLIALPTIASELKGMTTLDVLWTILGYQLVVATVLVNFGRLADMFGRVRLYNMGFAIFTIGSGLCSISQSPMELISFRVVQAIGAGFLFSNSAAIITDTFPPSERGSALGINQISIVVGSVTGLIAGGSPDFDSGLEVHILGKSPNRHLCNIMGAFKAEGAFPSDQNQVPGYHRERGICICTGYSSPCHNSRSHIRASSYCDCCDAVSLFCNACLICLDRKSGERSHVRPLDLQEQGV